MKIENNTENSRIARNTIYMAIRMVVVLVINLYVTRVILTVLGVIDYGIFNVVSGLVALFGFLNAAMTNGIQRYYNFEIGKSGTDGVQRVFNVSLRVQIIVSILLLLLVEIVGIWYVNEKMVLPDERRNAAFWTMQSTIFSFLLVIMQVPFSAAVIAKEKMSFYAIMSVLNSVFTLIVAIALPFTPADKLITYGITLFVINLLVTICFVVYSKRTIQGITFTKVYDKNMLSEMLRFSGWNMFGTFAGVGVNYGIDIIMNYFFGPVVNAAKGVANQVNGGLQSLVANLNISARPQVTKSFAQGNIERMFNLTFSISKLSSVFFFLFALPILLEIDFVLKIWLGDNVPQYSATFLRIIIFISFVGNFNTPVSGVIHSTGNLKKYQLVGSIINISSLPVIFIAMEMGFPAEVSLWILLLFVFINQIAALLIMKSLVPYSLSNYVRAIIVPVLGLIISASILPCLIHHFLPESFFRFVIVTIVSLACVISISYLFVLNESERDLCHSYFVNVRNRLFRH